MAAVRGRLAASQTPPPRAGSEQRISIADLLDDAEDRPTDICSRKAWAAKTPVSSRDCPVLVRLDGASAGQPVAVDKTGPLRFGRGKGCDLRIDDDGVSRTHAALHPEEGGWALVDLASSNGTSVQGERISRRRLADGDVIHLGPRVSFRFSMVDSAQQAMMMRLYESSTRDALTGSASRKHFDERLRAEVAYATRHAAELSLLMLDIDHFKVINDTHGHPAGDAVLRFVAGTVQSRLRTEDVLGRWGGEEFAVLLRGSTVGGGARAAERLRVAIAGRCASFEGAMIPATASFGCASLSCLAQADADELVATADRRLYLAKRAGRNRIVSSG
jgi:diguanylate cyclase (GGDEF)-like protein